MRNNKFNLSNMIPNVWFYKHKEIGKGKNQTTTHSKNKNQSSSLSSTTTTRFSKSNQTEEFNPRKSYYFTRELNLNQNKNNHNKPKTKTSQTNNNSLHSPIKTSLKTCSSPKLVGFSCRTTLESVSTKSDSSLENFSSSPLDSLTESESSNPEFRTDRVLIPTESSFDEFISLSTSCSSCNKFFNNNDIFIDVDENSLARKDDKLESYYSFSKVKLPPIIRKQKSPMKKENKHIEEALQKIKILNEQQLPEKKKTNKKKKNSSLNSPGVKLRVNSPRIANRKIQLYRGQKSVFTNTVTSGYRRSFSGSLAIVKSSFNPQKDFRESMVEMIVENNIRTSKDLEDLLACYLSLNSDEYHELIIKVFKQIWFDLIESR